MKDERLMLAIESSCDDTGAAIVRGTRLLSNVLSSQQVHEQYGGVVPELASRAHIQNIVPTVSVAVQRAGISLSDIQGIAVTLGPGLIGSLAVGVGMAKGLSLGLGVPLYDVNHLHAHVLAHFIQTDDDQEMPEFPYLCLLASGGNSQLVLVKSPMDMEILGHTIDDAAGEAFDKCAKVVGLPYPGGPVIDSLAQHGNAKRFKFAKSRVPGLDYSFSGLKTSFLYLLRDELNKNPDFIKENVNDLAASLQYTIIEMLMVKLREAVHLTGVKHVAIGGGVSANSGLRNAVSDYCRSNGLKAWIPPRQFTTDNAAMVAVAANLQADMGKQNTSLCAVPFSKLRI